MMKVLLVNDCPPGLSGSGGVETHIRQLKEALVGRGMDTAILASQQPGLSEYRDPGLFLIPDLNAPPLRKQALRNHHRQQAALKKAEEILRQFQPDVIHIHNFMNPVVLHMLRQKGAVVKSIHDCRPFCVKPYPAVASRLIGNTEEFCDITFGLPCWSRCYAHAGSTVAERIEAWSYFPANMRALNETVQFGRLIVYSRYLKELALRRFDSAEHIHIIHHFSDAEQASADLPVEQVKDPVFLFAGRLSPEKGILQIFDALELIPDVSCRLIIAGDGPIRKDVERRIQTCSPRHIVEMKGFVNQQQLYDLYRQSAVLLFPSIGSEGCPLTGIEAMYFGIPAVGYDTGGVGEWLIDGETGILLQRGDIDGLARAIKQMAASPELSARLGLQARSFIRRNFQKDRHISQLIEVYEQTLKDRGGRSHESR